MNIIYTREGATEIQVKEQIEHSQEEIESTEEILRNGRKSAQSGKQIE